MGNQHTGPVSAGESNISVERHRSYLKHSKLLPSLDFLVKDKNQKICWDQVCTCFLQVLGRGKQTVEERIAGREIAE